jgi:hypothetical protein
MAKNPFGGYTRTGVNTRRMADPIKGIKGSAEIARFELVTGIGLQRFMRDTKGKFLPNLQSNAFYAHDYVGYMVVNEAAQVLQEKMDAHSPKRPGRARNQLRRALNNTQPWQTLRNGRGVIVDWDKELNGIVRDPRGNPYWRAVNDGFVRTARGHLFMRGGKFYAPRSYTARGFTMLGGGDPYMPRIRSNEHTFTYSFEGYYFVQEGMRRVTRRLNANLPGLYVETCQFPDAMLQAANWFGAGGKGTPVLYGPNPRSASGVSRIRDPRR